MYPQEVETPVSCIKRLLSLMAPTCLLGGRPRAQNVNTAGIRTLSGNVTANTTHAKCKCGTSSLTTTGAPMAQILVLQSATEAAYTALQRAIGVQRESIAVAVTIMLRVLVSPAQLVPLDSTG